MSDERLPTTWRTLPLSELAREFISGGTPSTKESVFWDGDIPWTTSAPITEADVTLERAQRYVTRLGLNSSASNLVPEGSLLVGTRVGVGKAVVNLIDIAISQDLTGVVVDTAAIDPQFAAYQFKAERIQRYFEGRRRGTTIKGISRFDLESLELYVPPLPTQRAISRALRAVQQAAQARRREAQLQRERRGVLLRELIGRGLDPEADRSRSLDTIGVGSLPAHWDLVQLGTVAELLSGGTPSKERPDWWQGTIPWASPKDLKLPRLWDVQDHVTAEAVESGSRIVPAGSVFVVIRGMILSRQIPIALTMVPMAFNQDMKAIIPSPRLDPEYLLYALEYRRQDLVRDIGTSAHGTRRIGSAAIASLLIPLPPREEQKVIAAALRASDSVITGLEREAALLDELFRALLEELMTGRLRAQPLAQAAGE